MELSIAYFSAKNHSSLRLGSWGLDVSEAFIPSDTLFSALVNAASLLHGQVGADSVIAAVKEGQLRITSAFPRLEVLKDGETFQTFHFFPKPMLGWGRDSLPEEKKFRKVSFLDKELLQSLLSQANEKGGQLSSSFPLGDKSLVIFHHFAISRISDVEIMKVVENTKYSPFEADTAPKVTIDRLSSASQIFSQGNLCLESFDIKAGGSEYRFIPGFFFCFRADKEAEAVFKPALRLLADEGIGGKRSSGSGYLTPPKFESIDLDIEGTKYSTNLCLVFPGREEAGMMHSYMLSKRGGFIFSSKGTGFRKKLVRMVREGSIFYGVPQGDMFEVSEAKLGHRVYQYGYAFCLSFGE